VIGVVNMVWTAILEKNGKTSAICFRSGMEAKEALANIKKVMQCDGFSIMAILKGDQTKTFYGMNIASSDLSSD